MPESSSPTQPSTRRNKRKADDVDRPMPATRRKRPVSRAKSAADKPTPTASKQRPSKPSPKAPRKSPSKPSPKTPKNNPANLAKRASRNVSRQQPMDSRNSMSLKEKEQFSLLLKKARSDGSMSLARQSDSSTSEEEDEEEEEEEQPQVFDAEDVEAKRNDDDNNDCDNENDQLDENGKDIPMVAPNLGESDGEQDVSFNERAVHENDNIVDEKNEHESPIPDDEVCPLTHREYRIDDDTTIPQRSRRDNRNTGNGQQVSESVDESVILNVVQVLRQSLVSKFDNSFGAVLKEIRADREQIHKLREHVTELTSIVTATASSMLLKHQPSNTRTKEIHTKLCLLPAMFNDQVMLKIIPRVVIGFLVTNVQDGLSNYSLETKGIDLFSILFFSKQPKEKRNEKYNSDLGKVYSKFRYSLSMTSFLAMQNNTFNTFRTDVMGLTSFDPTSATEEETSTVSPSLSAMV